MAAIVSFNNGPCEGSLQCTRAPKYLRATLGPRGKPDVLDLLEDTPNPDERVYVYEWAKEPTSAFICGRGRGRHSGLTVIAYYRYRDDVDAEALALWSNTAWRRWVCSQEPEVEIAADGRFLGGKGDTATTE